MMFYLPNANEAAVYASCRDLGLQWRSERLRSHPDRAVLHTINEKASENVVELLMDDAGSFRRWVDGMVDDVKKTGKLYLMFLPVPGNMERTSLAVLLRLAIRGRPIDRRSMIDWLSKRSGCTSTVLIRAVRTATDRLTNAGDGERRCGRSREWMESLPEALEFCRSRSEGVPIELVQGDRSYFRVAQRSILLTPAESTFLRTLIASADRQVLRAEIRVKDPSAMVSRLRMKLKSNQINLRIHFVNEHYCLEGITVSTKRDTV